MPKKFLNLIYPEICGFCNRINSDYLCRKCELNLQEYEINKIEKCKNKYFDYLICLLRYEDIVRSKMISYKFNEQAYLHRTFAKIVLKNKKICSFLNFYDIIIPVPMHQIRKSVRGYNQTELIALELAKELKIGLDKKVLIKIKDTNVQSTLLKNDRQKNVEDAFLVKNKESIYGKKIILFDDIYTTGSTVNECAKVLKESGAKKVAVLTIAKD